MSSYSSGYGNSSDVSTDRRLGSRTRAALAALSWTIALGAAVAFVFTLQFWLFLPMVAAVGVALFFTVKAFDRRTTPVPPPSLVTLAMWSFVGALVLIALFIVIYKFEFGGIWLFPVNLVIGLAGYGMVIVGVVYLARSIVASSRERRFRRVSAESAPISASKVSVVSLVLGLIGFPCGAVLVSPIATYLGLVGIRRAQREHRATDGLAVIGFSLGLLGSVAAVTAVAVYVIASYGGGT